MDFEKMMEMLKMFSLMASMFGSSNKTEEPKQNEPKKKEDMTPAERIAALEEMYAKRDEESELLKRLDALAQKAPKVNSDAAEPVGIDDIIKGLVPGLLTPDKEDK